MLLITISTLVSSLHFALTVKSTVAPLPKARLTIANGPQTEDYDILSSSLSTLLGGGGGPNGA